MNCDEENGGGGGGVAGVMAGSWVLCRRLNSERRILSPPSPTPLPSKMWPCHVQHKGLEEAVAEPADSS